MPKSILRLLLYWYMKQEFAVKWNNYVSNLFTVSNGVRQGGILSPHLFNIFIDDLSSILNKSGIGCHLNGVSYNNLMYADDGNIIAPSPSGLQKLLDICVKFAKDNDMTFKGTGQCG